MSHFNYSKTTAFFSDSAYIATPKNIYYILKSNKDLIDTIITFIYNISDIEDFNQLATKINAAVDDNGNIKETEFNDLKNYLNGEWRV